MEIITIHIKAAEIRFFRSDGVTPAMGAQACAVVQEEFRKEIVAGLIVEAEQRGRDAALSGGDGAEEETAPAH